MEFFNFEPEEYQILEEIEVDETIQRPEKVRFYTLEDQLVDATEKLIPRDRRYTRFELEKIKSDVQRFEYLYNMYVSQTIDGYEIQTPEGPQKMEWVHPATTDQTERYAPEYDYVRIHQSFLMNPRAPGYYPRLLASLPRLRFPDAENEVGNPYIVMEPTTIMDNNLEKSIKRTALPTSKILRTAHHSDEGATTHLEAVGGTSDTVKFIGYRIEPRPVDIPNPNPDHPFFRENKSAFIESTAPIYDVFPSISAILEHGVPVTRDPYGEGQKYLKVYDVKLSNIPWSLWRTRFPPIEVVTKSPQIEDLKFPKPAQNAPAEKILKAYGVPYFPGISARHWLMQQPDGGNLIVRALLADSFTNGSVPAVPGLPLGPIEYPSTTLDQCILTGKIFEEFQTAGVVRVKITEDKDTKDIKVTFSCVPPEFVLQERRQLGYINRVPFREEAPAEILKGHVDALGRYRPNEKVEKKEIEAKTPARPVSEKRTEVLAILTDERRVPLDKTRDIRELLKTAVLENQIYSDTDGLFVVCSHTLAVLNGDFASDRRKFYEDWTASEDGFRVCKFCGEQILRDDAIVQDEFDDSGRLIVNSEEMDQKVYTSETLAGYITGIKALQSLFRLDNPIDSTMYTLLTILHVLPEADKTERILGIARDIERKLFRPSTAGDEKVKLQKGVLGIAMTVIMLQTHLPLLVPRRSFGSRPLKLDGYPRDKPKAEDITIVDSLLRVISSTYDAFPTAVKGPTAPLIRAVLRNSNQIKKAAIQILDVKVIGEVEQVRVLLGEARARYAELPPPAVTNTALIDPVVPSMKLGVVEHAGECRSTQMVWTNGRPPRIAQEEPPLRPGITAAANATPIVPSKSRRTKVSVMPTPEIVERRKLGTGAIKYALDDGWRTNLMLASRLSDLFQLEIPVATVDPRQGPDELRDISKGYVYQALQEIQTSPVKMKRFAELRNSDLTLLMLSAKIDLELAAVNRVLARQRKTFVQRMAEKSDFEREMIEELKRRGMAPIIITTEDRELFASEIENELRPRMVFEEEEAALAAPGDDGVGLPQAPEGPEEDAPGRILDRGDYGDGAALPVGRDYEMPALSDDVGRSV